MSSQTDKTLEKIALAMRRAQHRQPFEAAPVTMGDVRYLLEEIVRRDLLLADAAPNNPGVHKYDQTPLRITSPHWFAEDEPCGYCQRAPGDSHESWCRQ